MKLSEIKDNAGAHRPRQRLGRGIGSGTGKTAGKGHKGQKARSGGNPAVGFEGGQMPLHRRLPKRGFHNLFRRFFVEVNLGTLQSAIESGKLNAAQPIDEKAMQTAGLFKRLRDGVRLLGNGKLTTKVTLHVTGASKPAIAAVEQAGGAVQLIAQGKATATAASGATE
jgi:large subunit ribosomal protein L15